MMSRGRWLAWIVASCAFGAFVQCTGSEPDLEKPTADASTGGDATTLGDASSADVVDSGRVRLPKETLVDGEIQPSAIAIAGGTLYWVSFDGAVRSCTAATCATTKKDMAVPDTRVDGGYDGGSAYTSSILVDATYVYWPSYANGYIFRCPRTGCEASGPERWMNAGPAAAAPVALAMDDANVYWSDYGTPPVRRCTKAAKCAQQNVADGTPFPGALAVGGPNAEHLFWLSGDVASVTGTLSRVKKDVLDAGPSVVDFEIPSPSSLAVTQTNVFFTSTDDGDGGANSGTVWKGLASEAPATQKFAGGLGSPQAIAVDAENVYWVETTSGRVSSCPRTGCDTTGPVVLASGEDEPYALTLDDAYVYWTTRSGGEVKRVMK